MRLLRYGAVTISSYLVLLIGTYIGVDLLGFTPTLVYPIVLTAVYLLVYLASSLFVFKAKNHREQTWRYLVAVVVFWILNAGLYTLLVDLWDWNYLLSVVVNIGVFGPLRYLVYRSVVFKTTPS